MRTKNDTYNDSPGKQYLNEKPTYVTTILLFFTLAVTTIATATNCVSMMTDYWEYTTWDKTKIHQIAHQLRQQNIQHRIEVDPYLDDSVTKISIFDYQHAADNNLEMYYRNQVPTANVYLLPMHGGIWTLCISLTDYQISLLRRIDFPSKICFNYLSSKLFQEEPEYTTDWNYRMQNVSISCGLVCLIILGSAALIGAFGILKHQLSAILVTGVMYLLAGTFALFTVMIIHFKRIDCRRNEIYYHNSVNITIDNKSVIMDDGILQQTSQEMNTDFASLWTPYYPAREFHVGWSFDVAIIGVILSTISSVMWILMAKLLRYTPPLAVQL